MAKQLNVKNTNQSASGDSYLLLVNLYTLFLTAQMKQTMNQMQQKSSQSAQQIGRSAFVVFFQEIYKKTVI